MRDTETITEKCKIKTYDKFRRLRDWRTGRDSNSRKSYLFAGFQDRCLQPLGHLSASTRCKIIYFLIYFNINLVGTTSEYFLNGRIFDCYSLILIMIPNTSTKFHFFLTSYEYNQQKRINTMETIREIILHYLGKRQ